jgi:hypothetical protein
VIKTGKTQDTIISARERQHSLLGNGLLSGLSGLSTTSLSLVDGLDDTDGDSLTHVTDGKATKRRVLLEALNAEGLGGDEGNHDGITLLDALRGLFEDLTVALIDLLKELSELAGNVSSVAIEDGSITSVDLSGVVEDDDLGKEVVNTYGGIVLGVTSDETTTDLLNGDVLNVESDVVSGNGLGDLLVMHLDGLDLSGEANGGEGDDHTGLDNTSLDTADGYGTNTTNLVDVLEGDTERTVRGTLGLLDSVERGE